MDRPANSSMCVKAEFVSMCITLHTIGKGIHSLESIAGSADHPNLKGNQELSKKATTCSAAKPLSPLPV